MIECQLIPRDPPIQGVAGPVPYLRILAILKGRVESGSASVTPSQAAQCYLALDLKTTIMINGVLPDFVSLELGPRFGEDLASSLNNEVRWQVRLPRYLIEAIESTRTHDVPISVSVELRYFLTGAPPHETLRASFAHLPLKISQKDWLDALAAMGYQGAWIFEVERPSIEGWPKVVEFLDRSSERIAARDPEGAIAQCRAAWRALKPLIDHLREGIAKEVDRGSTQESGYPLKSVRIENLQNAVLNWTHTGDHPENYAATMDDALLAYRLTASLLSFLSRKSVQAETHATSNSTKP